MKLGVRTKLFAISVTFIVSVTAVTGYYLEDEIAHWFSDRLRKDLRARANLVSELIESAAIAFEPQALDPLADRAGAASNTRVTIIADDGRVLGDSKLSEIELRDTPTHLNRHEVQQALRNGEGYAERHSETVGHKMHYLAIPFERVDGKRGVIRLALSAKDAAEAAAKLRSLLVVASVGGLIMALLMTMLAAQLMTRALRELLRHTRSVADRDLRTAQTVFGSDELGGLAGSLRQLSEDLETTVATLARERDRFGAILENMNEAVIALDDETRITLVNKAGLAILGLDSPPTNRGLLEVMRSPALHELVRASREGVPGTTEFDLHGTKLIRIWARVTPLPEGQGSVLVMRDVTELRRLERVRRDFVANVSHELRTPVSVIQANIETLVDGALDDRAQAGKFAEAARRNAIRLSALVSDLLDISRIEAGKYRLEPEAQALAPAVEHMIEAVSLGAKERGIKVVSSVSSDVYVRADMRGLEQVLLNLIDNAVKYGKDGGSIEVRSLSRGATVRVEIVDDGPGIEPQHRSRIFERFYRVDTGRSRAMGGTGLGLAIVKNLVEAMQGQVGVDGGDSTGSIFWFQLPQASTPVETDTTQRPDLSHAH